MHARCRNPRDPYFARYGGRGIAIAPEWETFEVFLADMGVRPAGLTLERKDNDLNYTKDNCVWATRQQQSVNRSITIWFEIDGDRQHLAEWCRLFGISQQSAMWRIKAGWPADRAFNTPTR